MINVSQATKQAYMSDLSRKRLRVVFPEINLTVGNDQIETESLRIKESLMADNVVEFVGCNASTLSIKIYGIQKNIKGRRIEVYITADLTDEIPIFKGIVDSAVIDSNKYFKTITAYDVLYTAGQMEISGWYNNLFASGSKTMRQIRNSLCQYLGITQEENQDLPNDNIVIEKQYQPSSLKAITVLKSICQINGACGIINRYGKLEYRFIVQAYDGIYPAVSLFPSEDLHPEYVSKAFTFPYYEKLNYQEYYVKATERVQIRETEDDIGITAGAYGNKYIIQGNMFAYGLGASVKLTIANNILTKLAKAQFYPCQTANNGLPYVEVGDQVEYVLSADRSGAYATSKFIVMERSLSGIQFLRDSYSASGSEEQSEFITDLQAQIDAIKHTGVKLDNYYDKEEMDSYMAEYAKMDDLQLELEDQLEKLETPVGFNIKSVETIPSKRDANTVYLVRGGVIIY